MALEERIESLERKLKDKRSKSEFVIPSPEAVADYFLEREQQASQLDANIFAEKFIAHYTNTDWRYGKGGRKLKCWKSAVVSSWDTKKFVTSTNLTTIQNGKFNSDNAMRIYQQSLTL